MTHMAFENIKSVMPKLYYAAIDNEIDVEEISLKLIDPYLYDNDYLIDKLNEHWQNHPVDAWYDVLFSNDQFKIEDTKNMGYYQYKNKGKVEAKLYKYALNMIESKCNDSDLEEYLFRKLTAELTGGKVVIYPAKYMEHMLFHCDNIFGKERYINALLEAYLCNMAAFEEYAQDRKDSILSIVRIAENKCKLSDLDEKKIIKIKNIIGAEDIFETVERIEGSLEKRLWYEVSKLLYKIDHEMQRYDVEDGEFVDAYSKMVSDLETCAFIEEDVNRIIVFSHFDTIYYALDEDGRRKKLREYLANIEAHNEWRPEQWFSYQWGNYWHYFRLEKDFVNVQKSFSFFGKICWYRMEADDHEYESIWDNSIKVLEEMRSHHKKVEYAKGIEKIDRHCKEVPDVIAVKWLSFRLRNYNYDPLSKEEISRRINDIILPRLNQLMVKIETEDVGENPHLQGQLERDNNEIISMIRMLGDQEIDVVNEYKEKVCELLMMKMDQVIPEVKKWYEGLLEEWRKI